MSELIRAMFAMEDEVVDHGDYVIRTGKYFECDKVFTDMNGKEFSISQAEADANLPKFSGGPINIEHAPSFLDGLLGSVDRTWRDGKDILAAYRIPKDLHNLTKGKPIKISSEWDMQAKMPTGAGLVINPAVSDAIMMAAFAKAAPMQSLHDSAVEYGAECGGKAMFAEDAKFITPALLKAIQHVHDHSVTNGASCDLHATRKSMYGYYKSIDDKVDDTQHKEKHSMATTWDEVKAFFSDMGKPAPDSTPVAKIDPTVTAEIAALRAELSAERTKRETAEGARFATDAAAQLEKDTNWVESQIRAFKILPAVKEDYLALAKTNPAAFAAQKPLIEKSEPVAAVAGSGKQGGNGASFRAAAGSADGDALVQMATNRMKDTKEDFGAAFSAVCRENPALAESHRAVGAGTKEGN